jgi:hypothetical protein
VAAQLAATQEWLSSIELVSWLVSCGYLKENTAVSTVGATEVLTFCCRRNIIFPLKYKYEFHGFKLLESKYISKNLVGPVSKDK